MKKGEETARAKKQDERRDETLTRMRHGLRDILDITYVIARIIQGRLDEARLHFVNYLI